MPQIKFEINGLLYHMLMFPVQAGIMSVIQAMIQLVYFQFKLNHNQNYERKKEMRDIISEVIGK